MSTQPLDHNIKDHNREIKIHVYAKRQHDLRFKLRISQNRKLADTDYPEQFLCIKLA